MFPAAGTPSVPSTPGQPPELPSVLLPPIQVHSSVAVVWAAAIEAARSRLKEETRTTSIKSFT